MKISIHPPHTFKGDMFWRGHILGRLKWLPTQKLLAWTNPVVLKSLVSHLLSFTSCCICHYLWAVRPVTEKECPLDESGWSGVAVSTSSNQVHMQWCTDMVENDVFLQHLCSISNVKEISVVCVKISISISYEGTLITPWPYTGIS